MPDWSLIENLGADKVMLFIRTVLWILIGLPAVLVIAKLINKQVAEKYTAQQGMIFSKAFLYAGMLIILFSVLHDFGFKLTHILTAAGIIGIAVGFAAQTSFSNIISGIFLMAEQPFIVNDVIQVGNTIGVVLSIDFLSVKLRTFDNKFVRIPNETILKLEVTTITRFPIRRVNIKIGVAYREDIGRVKEILLDIAHKNPLCLQEPEPIIIFEGMGASSLDFTFGVWAEKGDWLALKNSIQQEVKERFDAEGIEIPFPHLTIYKGSESEPFPVQLLEKGSDKAS